MLAPLRDTGLDVVGVMPWGSHCCHFFRTQQDLLETLVPYFKTGLEHREFCLWIIHKPLTEARALRALERSVPDGARHLADRSLEIVSSREWYLKGGVFSLARVLRAWDAKLEQAAARGYAGMRANGNAAWVETNQWRRFAEYERALDESLAGKPMIVMCSYALERCGAVEVLDVARTHRYAIAKRDRKWEVVEWRTPPTSPDLYRTLTAREREVLALAAEGEMNPQIAATLSIGVRTVETHRANLMRKLGLRNQTELVRYSLARRQPSESRQRQATSLTRQRPRPRVRGRGSEPPRRRRRG
jgi:DNA-binding CsgD family transcriptional regulator